MKNFKPSRSASLVLAFVFWCLTIGHAPASGKPVPSSDGRQSKLWLVGDSSLHAYSSTANNVQLELSPTLTDLPAGKLKTLKVTIPVKEMRSGRNQLDKNMQTTLKADAHPNIVFEMKSYEAVRSTATAEELVLKTKGTLSVAGVEKEIDLEGTYRLEDGRPRIQGVKELLMTDFGIKPPKILLIKTSNEVKIHFDLWINPAGELE